MERGCCSFPRLHRSARSTRPPSVLLQKTNREAYPEGGIANLQCPMRCRGVTGKGLQVPGSSMSLSQANVPWRTWTAACTLAKMWCFWGGAAQDDSPIVRAFFLVFGLWTGSAVHPVSQGSSGPTDESSSPWMWSRDLIVSEPSRNAHLWGLSGLHLCVCVEVYFLP